MPNTLAHLGINGLTTRALIKKADLLLIYVGSVIPDFPWILQRLMSAIQPSINNYDLRLYSIILSSLFLCLILSFTLANFFKNVTRTFIIFSFGSLVHLLLDSFETKWGNGVHLLAPFSWELINFQLFWPEEIIIYILTGVGIIYVGFHWKETIILSSEFSILKLKNFTMFIFFLITYLLLPFVFMSNVEATDNHFVQTLRNNDLRTGKYFEVDRGFFQDNQNYDLFVTPFKEELKVVNLDLNSSHIMSLRAKFISNDKIQIIEYHIHQNRDLFSYVGLFLLFLLMIFTIGKYVRKK